MTIALSEEMDNDNSLALQCWCRSTNKKNKGKKTDFTQDFMPKMRLKLSFKEWI